MSDHLINYDALVQDALLGVIRKLLTDAAMHGLPGDHHFYIAFDTTHPDVVIPSYLRAQHPKEMTIVFQHQFWDLDVHEDRFSARLSFNGKPEHLNVPFDALTGFLDPSVQFGLQFKNQDELAETSTAQDSAADAPATSENQNAQSGDDDETGSEGATVIALDSFRES